MTKALFFRNSEGCLCGFEIRGHSGLAPEGSDILCAAISAMSQLVINTLTEEFSVSMEIAVDPKLALLSAKLPDGDSLTEAAKGILSGFHREIETLQKAYPRNLSLREKQA